jgi:predicted dinucleotide-binding enzyme
MRVAVVGAGRIGGNIARRLAEAGHTVTVCFARDQEGLRRLAEEIGGSVATPAEAIAGAEIVVLSVPWDTIDSALEQGGSLEGRIVVDTTNQFGAGAMPQPGQTAAAFNAARMPGARYTKCFNTLTSAFQAQVAHREPRVVQWLCGDDVEAKRVVAGLVREAGYEPVDVGGLNDCAVMEAPRRPGAVYGEEYRLAEAEQVLEALRDGRPIPSAPDYEAG